MLLGIKDLMVWIDMEIFWCIFYFLDEKCDKKVREIWDNWFGKKYFFGFDSLVIREG